MSFSKCWLIPGSIGARGTDGKIYALDAVESDKLGYEIDGVMVSDFITPAWFQPTRDEPSAAIPLGSRRQRRNLGKAEWRRSQHRF